MGKREGLSFVLLTSVISGLSIYANKFAIAEMLPSVFTFSKNLFVGLLFLGLILKNQNLRDKMKKLSRLQMRDLIAVGLLGGALPFLLFFEGLKITGAINTNFIHKLLFVFAAGMSYFLFKRRLDMDVLKVTPFIFSGILLLFGRSIAFNQGDILVLLATMLWAFEINLSKTLLEGIPAEIVSFSRMFIGSIFLLFYLVSTGGVGALLGFGLMELSWISFTSILLFGYVFTFYKGLKDVSVEVATSVLVLSPAITSVLSLGPSIVGSSSFFAVVLISASVLYIFKGKAAEAEKIHS
jgi:drug/metabolite transporter (DMT)-like permease